MITWKMVQDRWNRMEVYSKPDFWDEAAEKNYGENGFNLWVNPHLNEIYHRVESEILHSWSADVAGTQMLDLGCGAGRFAREFAKRGATVTAVDFSSKSIEIAKRMTADPNITYQVGSVFDLDAIETYDWITCVKVLTVACKDIADLRTCLAKIHKALRPNGQLLSIEMCHTTFIRRVLKLSYADFKKELVNAGFEIMDEKLIEFIPARMALAFFEVPRWLTVGGFLAGEFLLKVFPSMSDQKLTLCRKL